MNINHKDLELRVCRESYDHSNPGKARKSKVFLTHKPTGIGVSVVNKSQSTAYQIALKELGGLLKNKI